jgi:hypothetical protein
VKKKKKKKKTANQMERSKRPDPQKQPHHPLLPKTQTRTSKTKPDRQGATPISNLPEIPTHGPHTPAEDPKAKAHAKHAPRSNCRSKPSTTAGAPVTAPPICHRRSRFVTRPAAPLAWVSPAGRDPPQPDSKHAVTCRNPLQTSILMPQTSILMPQIRF